MSFISAKKVQERFDVSVSTLQQWANNGKIEAIRASENGKRRYKIDDIERLFKQDEKEKPRRRVLYARISSQKQSSDLERQITALRHNHADLELFKDIGSSLNWKRRDFNSLLEQVFQRNISEIIVLYKDRLCRFAFELVEKICLTFGTKITILNSEERDQSSITEELSEDLLSIVTVFVAKNNGIRAGQNRKRKREALDRDQENSTIYESKTINNVQSMVEGDSNNLE